MCEVLKVSASSYYYWRKNPVSKRDQQQKELFAHIRQVYDESKGRYGSPRIAAELQARGIRVSRPRVARAMKKMGLKSIIRKKYRVKTTDGEHSIQVSSNPLIGDITRCRVAQRSVSAVSSRRPAESSIYLAVTLDLSSSKVVCWA